MPKTTVASVADAVAVLKDALAAGHTVQFSLGTPPHVNRTPPLVASCRLRFGLTRAEAMVFTKLLEHGQVEREPLRAAMSHDSNPEPTIKSLTVLIHKLRQKLTSHGVAIDLLWGQGYALTEEARARARKLLAESATTPDASVTLEDRA